MAKIAFELGQHVASVGVPERVRPALGWYPDVIEQVASGVVLLPLSVHFGQRRQGRQFFLDEINGSDAVKDSGQALSGDF
jgi:hypothetical protein